MQPSTPAAPLLLILNSGSSSVKFAVYEIGAEAPPRFAGKLTRLGATVGGAAELLVGDRPCYRGECALPDHAAALRLLLAWLHEQPDFALGAVAHRLVHGGAAYYAPQRITPELLDGLHQLVPLAPTHLPAALELVEEIGRHYPTIPQVACFDTAFFQPMPELAKQLPLPRAVVAQGVRRYGFHGLSYESVLAQLTHYADPAVARGRVVLAHLGHGASMVAVRDGDPVDTTMGFTPTGGLMMGTRPGDLDPGVLLYLLSTGYADAASLPHLLNEESGLRGVSDISGDMAELLALAPQCPAAAEAVALFGYLARKQLGALVAVLGGLDALVFTGGIGENAPPVRAAICEGFDFLGVQLNAVRNAASTPIISPEGSHPQVWVLPADEEVIIARHARQVLTL